MLLAGEAHHHAVLPEVTVHHAAERGVRKNHKKCITPYVNDSKTKLDAWSLALSVPEEFLEAGGAGLLREVHAVHGAHPLHQDGDDGDQYAQISYTIIVGF